MDERMIGELARAVVERRCALFVGPDLGESAGGYRGLPSSWQLAADLARECGYTGRLRPLPLIAQIFVRRRDRLHLVQYLRQRLGAADYRPLPIHEVIARIPFPVIVSGGWDLLLEQALERNEVPFRAVRLNTDLPFIDPGRRELLLYKPYGSIATPDRLRITEDDQLDVFYDIDRVVDDLRAVVERYTLVLIGYSLDQDAVFARIYHNIRRLQARVQPPAFAIYAQGQPEDGVVWEALGIQTLGVTDPVEFLYALAARVAAEERPELRLPPLDAISQAPRLTSEELAEQTVILNNLMEQLGVADLIERTDVPLLSADQIRDIESMRAAYERLTSSLAAPPGTARVWLRQGNLEYARGNYSKAEQYYRRAHQVDVRLPELYHNMHFVRLARNDWNGAMKFYRHAVRMQPDLAILPGRYQIQAILGSSEMAVVYLADDRQTNGRVAVKVMQRGRANADRTLALFQREAETLRHLQHPNIVELIDTQPYLGSYFIVTRYLEGPTLRDEIRRQPGAISLDGASQIIAEVGDALSHAHAQGIIHRDVKPSNILLIDGQAVLIDFGLARPLTSAEQTTLMTGGTLAYMAPEQALGKPGDTRTDVYGLASVLYELLTGRNPGQGNYQPPSQLRCDIISAIDLVIEKGREFNPDDRYSSVAAFLGDLRRAIALDVSSALSPRWLRFVAGGERLIRHTMHHGWWVLLAAVFLGFAIPAIDPGPLVAGLARLGAAALVIILLLTTITQWFTRTQASRLRGIGATAILASYGGLLGGLFGAASSLFWLRSLRIHARPDPLYLGAVGIADFGVFLVLVISFSLVTTGLLFLVVRGSGAVAQRIGRLYATGILTSFLLCISIMIALGVGLQVGWFGDVNTTQYPLGR
jgi:tetratricopeptide (TPR) repeat protein